MLMRTDPFRQLDRLTADLFGTAARPAAMPMDAWRADHEFIVEFDLPGVDPASIDLDVERNVLTVKAERQPSTKPDVELVASERPRGVFSRQVLLGDALDPERITASYHAGVLHLSIPVAEKAKPRKISIAVSGEENGQDVIDASSTTSSEDRQPATV
jgi:HSP20 family protein